MKINYVEYITLKELLKQNWFPYFSMVGARDKNGGTIKKEQMGVCDFRTDYFQPLHFRSDLYNSIFEKSIRTLIKRKILITAGHTNNGDNVFGLCDEDTLWMENNSVPYTPPKLPLEISEEERTTLRELSGLYLTSQTPDYFGTPLKLISGIQGTNQLKCLKTLIRRGLAAASNSQQTFDANNPMLHPPVLLNKVSRHFSGERFKISRAGLKYLFDSENLILKSLQNCPTELTNLQQTVKTFLLSSKDSVYKPHDLIWSLIFHSTMRNRDLEKISFDTKRFDKYMRKSYDATLSFTAYRFTLNGSNLMFVSYHSSTRLTDFKILADDKFVMNPIWEEFSSLITKFIEKK